MKDKTKKLLKELGISENVLKMTQPIKQSKYFTKVKKQVKPKRGHNYMADLLYLPESKEGFKYLLVVVDLWSDEFDIEPLKVRDAKTVLKAYKKMLKRKYIQFPKATFQTDGGSEFKGAFTKFIYDGKAYHRVTAPNRHTQQANVERLNRQLGYWIMNYLNSETEKKGVIVNDWVTILPILRESLNDMRKRKDGNVHKPSSTEIITKKPKYKIGDIVHWALDSPIYKTGEKANGEFRTGDRRFSISRVKINKVLHYPNKKVPFRYLINNDMNVSYTEPQLMKANDQSNEFFAVKEIIDKKKVKGKTFYKVRWADYPIGKSSFEPEEQLIEDGLKSYIDLFNSLS